MFLTNCSQSTCPLFFQLCLPPPPPPPKLSCSQPPCSAPSILACFKRLQPLVLCEPSGPGGFCCHRCWVGSRTGSVRARVLPAVGPAQGSEHTPSLRPAGPPVRCLLLCGCPLCSTEFERMHVWMLLVCRRARWCALCTPVPCTRPHAPTCQGRVC